MRRMVTWKKRVISAMQNHQGFLLNALIGVIWLVQAGSDQVLHHGIHVLIEDSVLVVIAIVVIWAVFFYCDTKRKWTRPGIKQRAIWEAYWFTILWLSLFGIALAVLFLYGVGW